MVAIELFSGILPATAALALSGLSHVTYFSEIANDPIEVTLANWPEAISIGDVRNLELSWFDNIVKEYPDALIWLTAGVPCKNVSKLNKNRSGAFGEHSGKFLLAAKFKDHLESITDNFVFSFECTKMDDADKASFSSAFKTEPMEINNRGWSPLSRPRLFWIGGKDPVWPPNTLHGSLGGSWLIRPKKPETSWESCLLPGYTPVP